MLNHCDINLRSSNSSGDIVQMMMPTEEIDDEETLTYKHNFLQNELNKQNFIYTIDKYRAVFSSVHIIALKVLSHDHHHHHSQQQGQEEVLQQNDQRHERQSSLFPFRAASNNSSNSGRPVAPAEVTNGTGADENETRVVKQAVNKKEMKKHQQQPSEKETQTIGFRIEGKFRFLNKSSYMPFRCRGSKYSQVLPHSRPLE